MGGLTSKLHAVVDTNGLTVRFGLGRSDTINACGYIRDLISSIPYMHKIATNSHRPGLLAAAQPPIATRAC